MQSNVQESILSALNTNKLCTDDILYVIYASGESLNARIYYSCGIESFLKIVNEAESVYDLKWPFDIRLVGEKFWFEFHYSGYWTIFKHPQLPNNYKRPASEDLLRSFPLNA